MADLTELKNKIKEAIDNGATNLEQIHKKVMEMPIDWLAKIGPLEAKAGDLKKLSNETIGNVYDFIRKLNSKVDEVATELLAKIKK